jgi:hypothetical protein
LTIHKSPWITNRPRTISSLFFVVKRNLITFARLNVERYPIQNGYYIVGIGVGVGVGVGDGIEVGPPPVVPSSVNTRLALQSTVLDPELARSSNVRE